MTTERGSYRQLHPDAFPPVQALAKACIAQLRISDSKAADEIDVAPGNLSQALNTTRRPVILLRLVAWLATQVRA